MKIRTFAQLQVALTMVVSTAVAHAFGHEGHEEVGAIADQLLQGSAAAAKVDEILTGMHLQQVAIWADCVMPSCAAASDKSRSDLRPSTMMRKRRWLRGNALRCNSISRARSVLLGMTSRCMTTPAQCVLRDLRCGDVLALDNSSGCRL